jgi:hypothetical protein
MHMSYRHGFLAKTAALLGAATAGLAMVPSDAEACGGCFAPNATVTVVTAHRMAVAISPTETTLWDQIQYAGSPEDFVWVLPVVGDTGAQLADNAFFEALSQGTTVNLQGTFPPFFGCSDPCSDSDFGASGPPRAGSESDGRADAGVAVLREETVGPYETVTISSPDPMALVEWLQENGYGVPDSILPTISHYVDQDMNFLALRLSPNAGVDRMQPVRVTNPGMNPIFPLKMVAAGVSDSVSLELYIFGDGRYELQNFPTVEIDQSRIVWDWTTNTFNYEAVFAETIRENDGGRGWIVEYAALPPDSLSWYTTTDSDGTVHRAADDYAIVMRGLASPYLTKVRTDLAAAHLDQDIILQARLTGGDVSNFVSVPREVNRPVCETVCRDPGRPGGGVVGTPGGGTIAFGGGRGDGICSASSSSSGGPLSLLGIVGLVATALVIRSRRRR